MLRKFMLPGSVLAATALAMALAFTSQGGGTATAGVVEPTTTGVAGTSTAVRTTTVVQTTTAVPTGTPSLGQGCTPGFWKTHTDTAKYPNAWPPTGYSSSQTVGSVFAVPYASLANATLAEGLAFQGGDSVEGKSEILLRAAIAAVLNAAHPNINYPLSVAGIVGTVNAALASGDGGTITALAGALDSRNNLGCSISGK